MLENDSRGVEVKTLVGGPFPKGTKATILIGRFIDGTTTRAYCIQTTEDIEGLLEGPKSDWYLARDLQNI